MSHGNGLTRCPGNASGQRMHGVQLKGSVFGFSDMDNKRAVSIQSSFADGLGCLDLHAPVCESLLGPWHFSHLPYPDILDQL